MSMSFLPMILMFLGTSGGMNELLDLTDPQSFLQAQGIEYRIEAMLEVLSEPATKDIDQLKTQEVKKLLAMRALGAMKNKAALPALQKAAAQKTQFFHEYASEAIAAIEGHAAIATTASTEDLKKDLALLPAGIALVVQARLDAGSGLDFKKVVGEALAAIPDGPDPDEVFKQVNAEIGKVAGKIGNARLDAVTLGLSSDVGNDAGFVVIIARGEYDHRALESMLSEMKRTEHHEIGGTMFLGIDGGDLALAPVSSELLVMVSGPGWDHFPLEQVAAKLKARPTEPVFSKKLQAVIARADRKGAVWGAALIAGGMKEAPPFAPFDEVVLSTRELKEKNMTRLQLEGTGSDAAAITNTFDQMKGMVEQGIAELEQQSQPGMQPILKIMRGLKFTSIGQKGMITADFDGNPANIVSILVPLFGVRASVDHGASRPQSVPSQRVP